VPRAPEADESLAALLARRDQVRSRQPASETPPSPELFRPQRPVVVIPARQEPVAPSSETRPAADEQPTADQPVSTASRLLEAKRRAQQRKP